MKRQTAGDWLYFIIVALVACVIVGLVFSSVDIAVVVYAVLVALDAIVNGAQWKT